MTPKRRTGLSDEGDYVLKSKAVEVCVELGCEAEDEFILCFCVLLTLVCVCW